MLPLLMYLLMRLSAPTPVEIPPDAMPHWLSEMNREAVCGEFTGSHSPPRIFPWGPPPKDDPELYAERDTTGAR